MLLPGNLKKKEREKEQKLVLCKLRNRIFVLLISEVFVSVAGNIKPIRCDETIPIFIVIGHCTINSVFE